MSPPPKENPVPPEQRVIDNPNDIAIRELQRQQRLEMGKTIEKNNAKVISSNKFREPFYFRFRQHKDDNFGGLWELAVVDNKGKVDEVITDADTLSSVLDAISRIFENAGF